MSEAHVMDRTGDTTLEWDKDNADEVENARETFTRLRGKGHRAFRVNPSGGKAQRMDTFDPSAEAMIMVPHVGGG
jgi:hypothetical protein